MTVAAVDSAVLMVTMLFLLMSITEQDGVCRIPLGRVFELDISTTKRVAIPNDASSESFRRDDANADLFGTGTVPTVVISRPDNRLRGGDIHRRDRN